MSLLNTQVEKLINLLKQLLSPAQPQPSYQRIPKQRGNKRQKGHL